MAGKTVKVSALVVGGKASAGPPIGPALGATGVNLYQVVQKINEKTKEYMGLKIPVYITVDRETKEFEVEIGMPPTSALLIKEIKDVDKGSGTAGIDYVGDITLSKIIEIAKMKDEFLLGKNLKSKVKTIIGTCRSCGITIDGKKPKELIEEINENQHDDLLK
ncbi:MAG: 50S ribosomal protein L11 [Candidatus Helarchaeota archaeon]